MDENQLRNTLCQVAQQLWLRGLVVADEGILSAVVHRRRYLVTPPGLRHANLAPDDLACVDLAGESVLGAGGIDTRIWGPHRALYRADDERVRATALILPPSIAALCELRSDLDTLNLPGIGSIATLESDSDGELVRALGDSPGVVVRGLGVLSAGTDLAAALNAVERIERAASIELALHRHG